MDAKDIMTMGDEELANLEITETTQPVETDTDNPTDKSNDLPVEESTTPEDKPSEEAPQVKEEDGSQENAKVDPMSILSMPDEEFEKFANQGDWEVVNDPELDRAKESIKPPKEGEELYVSPEDKVPTIEELQAKVAKANETEEKYQALAKHKTVVDILDKKGLLEDKNKLNHIVDVASGNKEAIFALLKAQGFTAEEVVRAMGTGSVTGEQPPAVADKQETSDDEDDFDSWLRGEDSENKTEDKPEDKSESKSENKSENKPEDKPVTQSTYKPTDYESELANHAIGSISQEILNTEGQEFLNELDSVIDTGSFQMLQANPEDLRSLAQQKKSGVMDIINERVEELRNSGVLPPGIPYLTAYQLAGNMLIKEEEQANRKPIDTKVGKPSTAPINKNINHADTTSSSRPTGDGSKPKINPMSILTMSDEEFDKL